MLSKIHRRTLLLGTGAFSAVAAARPRISVAPGWQSLWNGKDLQGWTTWMGIPHKSRVGLDLPKTPEGNYAEPLGENVDPRGVYTVVQIDGQPAIRVSGELFGALTSSESFSDYHLSVKWRWGIQKWEPRAIGPRDSGILIHATGPHGASGPSHNWMRSIECQIQEGDCGDLWSVGGVQLKAKAKPFDDKGQAALRFDEAGPVQSVPLGDPKREARVRRRVNAERPLGAWNVTEIFTKGDRAEFKVNGQSVMSYSDARIEDRGTLTPLTRGRIQLQCEGAEIYFSEVKLRKI